MVNRSINIDLYSLVYLISFDLDQISIKAAAMTGRHSGVTVLVAPQSAWTRTLELGQTRPDRWWSRALGQHNVSPETVT